MPPRLPRVAGRALVTVRIHSLDDGGHLAVVCVATTTAPLLYVCVHAMVLRAVV